MKLNKFAVLTNLCLALLVGVLVSFAGHAQGIPVDGSTPYLIGGLVFAGGFAITGTQGAFMAGIQKEVWQDVAKQNLFFEHEWISKSNDASQYVLDGAVVHIPQGRSKPGAVRNRTRYPIPAVINNDKDVSYVLDEYSTDSDVITNAQKIELAADQLTTVINNHMGVLRLNIAKWMAYRWSATKTANLVKSSGSNFTDHPHGLTGNRKRLTVADFKAAKEKLQNQLKKRVINAHCIITTKDLQYLMTDTLFDDDKAFASNGIKFDTNGNLESIHGITIHIDEDEVLPKYDSSDAIKAPESVVAVSTDNSSVPIWVPGEVQRAIGSIKYFESLDDTDFQGDVYNALVRAGGRNERTDQEGVVMILIDA